MYDQIFHLNIFYRSNILYESFRPSKVDPVVAVGVSSSKPNNPRKETKHTHSKKKQTEKVYLAILRVKNKFNGGFFIFF